MTVPLWLLAIPSIFLGIILSLPGPPLGPLLGFAPDTKGLLATWLEPVFAQGEALLGRAEATFSLFGIDGVLILASVAVAVDRHGRRLAAVRGRALAAPLDRQPRARPDADRPRAVPLPRVAEQVVVRRPQPPAVHRSSAGGSRRSCGGSTGG